LPFLGIADRTTSVNFEMQGQFTGKERDAETGLDYFGARYFSGAQGRFTSPDPLMASARTSEPQSWNRYAYAFNNPLKYTDPNGMDVPKECIDNQNCTIKISLNVIYDKDARFSAKDRQRLERDFLKKAQKDYKNSNIELDVSYSEGTFKRNTDGNFSFSGVQSDKLNVYFSDATPTLKPGVAFNLSNGAGVVIVDPTHMESLSMNVYPLGTNTLEHEMGHHLLGHTDRQMRGTGDYVGGENSVDWRVFKQSWGADIPEFRQGTEKKVYAVPANPELNKPRQR
jgi:RHS repeat-associated protein